MRVHLDRSTLDRLVGRLSASGRARVIDRRAAAVTPTPVLASNPAPGVLEIRLAGGARRNVLGRSTISRTESLIEFAPAATRVILLSAEGPDFSAGYDLLEAQADPAALLAHESNFAALRSTGRPVVAALHGNVIGGGLELALAADVRVAARDTRFAIPASALGLVYSEAGTRLLVETLGESVARAMLVGGRRLTAAEALTFGLVTEVVAPEELAERTLALATEIAGWSPLATAGNRQMLDAVTGRTVLDTTALRAGVFAPGGALSRSIAAFVERREHSRSTTRRIRALRLGDELLRIGRTKTKELGRNIGRLRPEALAAERAAVRDG